MHKNYQNTTDVYKNKPFLQKSSSLSPNKHTLQLNTDLKTPTPGSSYIEKRGLAIVQKTGIDYIAWHFEKKNIA